KLRWLREHGVRAARFHQPVSYLVERLTGAAVIDPPHASTTLLYDLAAGAGARGALAAVAIDPPALPASAPACAAAGAPTPAGAPGAGGAGLAGLRGGRPVAVGTGDDFATRLGAGVAAPGQIICAIGTAEVVGAVAAQPVLDVPAARGARDPWRALPEPMVET